MSVAGPPRGPCPRAGLSNPWLDGATQASGQPPAAGQVQPIDLGRERFSHSGRRLIASAPGARRHRRSPGCDGAGRPGSTVEARPRDRSQEPAVAHHLARDAHRPGRRSTAAGIASEPRRARRPPHSPPHPIGPRAIGDGHLPIAARPAALWALSPPPTRALGARAPQKTSSRSPERYSCTRRSNSSRSTSPRSTARRSSAVTQCS
jgi:hypothetical protein